MKTDSSSTNRIRCNRMSTVVLNAEILTCRRKKKQEKEKLTCRWSIDQWTPTGRSPSEGAKNIERPPPRGERRCCKTCNGRGRRRRRRPRGLCHKYVAIQAREETHWDWPGSLPSDLGELSFSRNLTGYSIDDLRPSQEPSCFVIWYVWMLCSGAVDCGLWGCSVPVSHLINIETLELVVSQLINY